MDLISEILEQKGGSLISALVSGAGMGTDQAETFLPEAGTSVMEAMTSRADDLDLSDLASKANLDSLMGGIDIAGLASRSGVTAEQGTKGLSTILPMLLGFLGDKGDVGGLLGLLGKADDLGGAVDKLKGFGKLFG